MKLKSLLLGSAAALVAVSGARAADAVVIPEPEAVEYVRVCDAAGAGYFYIPGSETCLKISGYVQYEIGFANYGGNARVNQSGWKKTTEGRLQFDSWTDSEYGAVQTQIRITSSLLSFLNDPTDPTSSGTALVAAIDRATLSIGGLSMGLMGSLYDFSATGAADTFVANGGAFNSIQYTANFGANAFALQLQNDAINGATASNWVPDVIAKLSGSAGDVSYALAAVYQDNGTAASQWGAKATVGYMGFGAVVQYNQNPGGAPNNNIGAYRWILGANYGFDATDKLNLNVGAVYGFNHGGSTDGDWALGAEATYKLTNTFAVSARVRYLSDIDNTQPADTSGWDGRIRFKASF